jgi:hypothetical protein
MTLNNDAWLWRSAFGLGRPRIHSSRRALIFCFDKRRFTAPAISRTPARINSRPTKPGVDAHSKLGIHHVTAVTARARDNLAFYTKTLGMRLVKNTVNQDAVRAYHSGSLYFREPNQVLFELKEIDLWGPAGRATGPYEH